MGNNTTAPLEGQFAANLSQYAGGTIEFDLKVDANPGGKVFVALSCGYPCGTADYEITSQLTDATGWNRISIDLDTITATPKQSGVPFNLNSVTQPLIILPAWGEQQKGTIFKLDNIRYLPKAL
ncbi:hypothetical protein HGP28_14370 [Vibrio sp. SM6]|uniref:ExoP galactose-binding-like domain-containing protein n=1 Tax=Vibrio agarilyticus TaxID=2726741 RepID=A0A7X8TSL8_9VIBR|nr:hypothetical protein [Vibrio agarilyticus]